jgi:histidine triad (HIT) family protein
VQHIIGALFDAQNVVKNTFYTFYYYSALLMIFYAVAILPLDILITVKANEKCTSTTVVLPRCSVIAVSSTISSSLSVLSSFKYLQLYLEVVGNILVYSRPMRFVSRIVSCSTTAAALVVSCAASRTRKTTTAAAFFSPSHFSTKVSKFTVPGVVSSLLCYSTTTPTALAMTPPSDEVQKAVEAAAERAKAGAADDDGAPTIFDKIISGEIPSNKLHEDELCIAFHDVNPQAPTHFLVIPKYRDGLTQLSKARDDQKLLLGHLMYVAQDLAQTECPNGFRIVINDGKEGAQSVYHLHLHVLGGRSMGWPPG